jgi:hypothetical protein
MLSNKTFDASVQALVNVYPACRIFKAKAKKKTVVFVTHEGDFVCDAYEVSRGQFVRNPELFDSSFKRLYQLCFTDCELIHEPVKEEPKPKQKATPRKSKGATEKKPRTRKTTTAKGDNKPTKADWQSEVDTYAGKGRASNKAVASILRKHKMKPIIGEEGWTYWESIR